MAGNTIDSEERALYCGAVSLSKDCPPGYLLNRQRPDSTVKGFLFFLFSVPISPTIQDGERKATMTQQDFLALRAQEYSYRRVKVLLFLGNSDQCQIHIDPAQTVVWRFSRHVS